MALFYRNRLFEYLQIGYILLLMKLRIWHELQDFFVYISDEI